MILAGQIEAKSDEIDVANFNFEMKHAKCRGYVTFCIVVTDASSDEECPKRVAKRHSM
jgi:hypothetical protein